MSIRNLVLLGVVAIAAYWYYQNQYQLSRGTPLEQQWQQNAAALDKCVKQETTMAAAAGMAGVSMSLEDARAYCAGELGLYPEDGHWKKY
ncbi:hypothetical protein E2F43_12600 [Seongchinamella unica]|uniref:Uncharacterized protein n=1 Tax=Seongchinamella unica TaxID=2547392 RepID=A0A4R5LPN0_9GAMM|nr:hypothetical protein [Seongchinamella unica]TDG12439.1 hypothetical protein E2F43_12600 [Seongchinamella unica]